MAGFNSELPADSDLICAIRQLDAVGTARALSRGAAKFRGDALELLLACLDGSDAYMEIVRARGRGDSKPNAAIDVPILDAHGRLTAKTRKALSRGLGTGTLIIRMKVRPKGQPKKFWTKDLVDGAALEDAAKTASPSRAVEAFARSKMKSDWDERYESFRRNAWRSLEAWRSLLRDVRARLNRD